MKKIIQGNSQPANVSHGLIVDTNTLTILPYTLDANTLYRVELNVTSPPDSKGYAAYDLMTNDLPSDGSCNVSLFQGMLLKTTFVFVCGAWYDKHPPLTFQYWYSVEGKHFNLFYYGENSQSSPMYFEAGLEERNRTVTIKAIITDGLGASVVRFLSIKVGFWCLCI